MQTVICESFGGKYADGLPYLWRFKYFYDEDEGIYYSMYMDTPEQGILNNYGVYHALIMDPVYGIPHTMTDKGHWGC